MTKKEYLALDEKSRYDWMISIGWKADESGQVFSHKAKPVGTINKRDKYVEIGVMLDGGQKHTSRAHRFVFYYFKREIPIYVDHINLIKNDNRISNLRSVTPQQNPFNNGGRGYSFHKKKNKYQAYIRKNGTLIHLGLHETEEQARAAYLAAKQKYHTI